MAYEKTTYEEILAQLDEAVAWYERVLGRSITGTRLHEIRAAARWIAVITATLDHVGSLTEEESRKGYYALAARGRTPDPGIEG